MNADDDVRSPQLIALAHQLTQNNPGAVTAFWQWIRTIGTPLVEPHPARADSVLVTFVWRAIEPLHTVVVVGGLAGFTPTLNQMTQLGDTDLWYRTYEARADTRTTYLLSPNDALIAWKEQTWHPDPLNPRRFVIPKNDEDPQDQELQLSLLELPSAPAQPWIKPQADVAHGQLICHRLASTALSSERRVWSYTPAGYQPGEQTYPLLVLLDGRTYAEIIPTTTILDNLIAAEAIPPCVAILVDTSVNRLRDLQCSPPFTLFLARELMPWIWQHRNVYRDPKRVILGGSSASGLAAAYAGLHHPKLFGNILTQSGAFWWAPETEQEAEWLTRQYATTPLQPLRFAITAGQLETFLPTEGPNLLVANRHLRTVLQAKGYPVDYTEYSGGHDEVCWQGTLADSLITLSHL